MSSNNYAACALITTLSLVHFYTLAQNTETRDSTKTTVLQEVIVTAKPTEPSHFNLQQVSRQKIELVQSNTLGETLSHIPGIQNSYFGPNSGTPVIRSLSGNRVKVLTNGLSVNDLSGLSPNLNVVTDMDNLLEIDVYKGSASVLFGGKAIGGAVNMKDNTIPQVRFARKVSGFVTGEAATNNGFKQAFDLNGNLGKRWTWHAGAMNRSNKNLKIPGNTKAPIAYDPAIDNLTQTMAQVTVESETTRNLSLYPYISQFVLDNISNPAWGLSEADLYTFQESSVIDGNVVPNPKNDKYIAGQDPDTPFYTTIVKGIHDYAPVTKGLIPNSHSESRAVNLGASYVGQNFYTGVGYRGSYGYYGVPGFALLKMPGHTHGPVNKKLKYLPINTLSQSNSLLLEAGIKSRSQIISSLKINYMMQFADDRELIDIYKANKFLTNRQTARIELKQYAMKFLSGISGFDFSFMKMKGSGQQRYLPNNLSREYGVFTSQQAHLGPVLIDVGYRHDVVERRAITDATYKQNRGLAGGKLSARDFNLNQINAGLQWNFFKVATIRASFNHSERTPDVNELYAGNNHFAIMIEENGDDRLKKEISQTFDLGAGLKYKGLHFTVSHYHTFFNNYMYMAHTGIARSGGFLVKEWRQSDTKLTGWEAEASYKYMIAKNIIWELASYFDLVKNINTSNDHLRKWAEGDFMPNMPTSRYGFSSVVNIRKTEFTILFDRYLKQRYLGKNINPEPAMPAYSTLSARVSYRSSLKGHEMSYYLNGSNILNIEARPQNSLLKYLAPLPGRNISIGIKAYI